MKRETYVGLLIGLLVGCFIGFLATHYLSRSDVYSIQIMNERTAVKMNKRTGETWTLDRVEKVWKPVKVSNLDTTR